LTTLGSIGKSVSGLLNLEQLFARVLEAAIAMTEADHASLILRDDETNRLILRAGKNMTLAMQERVGSAINDEMASLVMTSGEPLLISGEGLKRFRVSPDIFALIYTPLTIQGKSIGVLTVGNHRKRRTFDNNMPGLLEILAGYAAIAIVNARLFTALERRARSVEQAYEELKTRDASRERAITGMMGLQQSLVDVRSDLTRLIRDSGSLPRKLAEPLGALTQKIGTLLESVEALSGNGKR
jgi:GAF domain-containing protein